MNFNKNKQIKKQQDIKFVKTSNKIIVKKLIKKIPKSIGRDQYGQLMYHRGGGVKKKYRILTNETFLQKYKKLQTQYDPYRTAYINLNITKNGYLFFNLAPNKNIKKVNNNQLNTLQSSMSLSLYDIPTKSLIYNIRKTESSNKGVAKSAGTYAKIFQKHETYATLILPSNEKKNFPLSYFANIGIVSNMFKKLNKQYKASTNRFLNKRPTVRGVAMNPVDHPHGGGEGKTTSKRPAVSP